jgi:hypothetical protein
MNTYGLLRIQGAAKPDDEAEVAEKPRHKHLDQFAARD